MTAEDRLGYPLPWHREKRRRGGAWLVTQSFPSGVVWMGLAGRYRLTNTDWVLTLSRPRVWPPAAVSQRCCEESRSPGARNHLESESKEQTRKKSAHHENDGGGKGGKKNAVEQNVKWNKTKTRHMKRYQSFAVAWVLKGSANFGHVWIFVIHLSGTGGELSAGLLWSPDGFWERSPVCWEVHRKAKTHRSTDPR